MREAMTVTSTIDDRTGQQNEAWPPMSARGVVELSPRTPAEAGRVGTWKYTYTVGEYGIDDGGGLKMLLPIPSDRGALQFVDPTAPEYGTVMTTGDAVVRARWVTKAYERPWVKGLQIDVTDGALAPGDHVVVVWGDTSGGSPGAKMQTYAETTSPVRVMVDAFATNVYVDVPGDTTIQVVPGPARALVAVADSEAGEDGVVDLRIRAIDDYGNVATDYRGSVDIAVGGEVIDRVDLVASDRGVRRVSVRLPGGGDVVRVDVENPESGMRTSSNPIRRASRDGKRLLWGDTQGQTGETVGAGSLDEFFSYARDVAGLDFVAHSANDFQVTRSAFAESLRAVDRYDEDGLFAAFGGFEWSGNTPVGGDHNVLYADTENAPLHRSSHALVPDHSDVETDRIRIGDLYETFAERGIDALTVCHVGGRRALPSAIDPRWTPVLELTSVHGWFEWFALDVIRAGHDVGFVAASDDHSGRPGASFPSLDVFGVRSGLAAVRADGLSRRSIIAAMRRRDVYATTGERILLDVSAEDARMGDIIEGSSAPRIEVAVHGTAPIEAIDVLGLEGTLATWRPEGALDRRRLRVSWCGARSRDRNRVQDWSGGLEVDGARILSAREWAFDHPDQGITDASADRVSWVSTTNGDVDGVELEFDEQPSVIRFGAGGVRLEARLDEFDDRIGFPLAEGVERAVRMEWLPAEPPSMDARAEFDDLPLAPGRNVFLVRVAQGDGHRAWASPIYVYNN